MKVENMKSPRSGKEVPNQIIIKDDNGNEFFQSYDSIVAKRDNKGNTELDENTWDYSNTTRKYRNEFLGMDSKEVRNAIDLGDIKLTDLNKN